MLIFDAMGRCIGEHVCGDNRHLCLMATVRAKQLSQANAFTTEHPAYQTLIALESHLTPEEDRWVNERVPGKPLNGGNYGTHTAEGIRN